MRPPLPLLESRRKCHSSAASALSALSADKHYAAPWPIQLLLATGAIAPKLFNSGRSH
ncbi:MAG: hypothetical protein VKK04_10710 [Synechococcales bacterium]|nr:hypothetical protein [Synechococcales bacterium]